MNPCVQLNTHRTSAPPLPNRIFSTPLSVVVHMNTSKNYSVLHTMSAQVAIITATFYLFYYGSNVSSAPHSAWIHDGWMTGIIGVACTSFSKLLLFFLILYPVNWLLHYAKTFRGWSRREHLNEINVIFIIGFEEFEVAAPYLVISRYYYDFGGR